MNKELNKKLADWAGFYLHRTPDIGDVWKSPDGRYTGFKVPRFASSLDACFKWLVPRLDYADISADPVHKGMADYAVAIAALNGVEDWATAETPALALCKAIEKLIDGE